jgi:hypothetical protein
MLIVVSLLIFGVVSVLALAKFVDAKHKQWMRKQLSRFSPTHFTRSTHSPDYEACAVVDRSSGITRRSKPTPLGDVKLHHRHSFICKEDSPKSPNVKTCPPESTGRIFDFNPFKIFRRSQSCIECSERKVAHKERGSLPAYRLQNKWSTVQDKAKSKCSTGSSLKKINSKKGQFVTLERQNTYPLLPKRDTEKGRSYKCATDSLLQTEKGLLQ